MAIDNSNGHVDGLVLDGDAMEEIVVEEIGFEDFGRYAYDYHDWSVTSEIIESIMADDDIDAGDYDFSSRGGEYADSDRTHASEFVEYDYGFDAFGEYVLRSWLNCDDACEIMRDFLVDNGYDAEEFELGEC